MNINIDNLNKNSLIMQWNVDANGNPASIHIQNEVQQISTTHNLIQLAQIPDDYYRVRIGVDGEVDWLREVYNRDEIAHDTYFVDYSLGYVYFDKVHAGKYVIADYYGRGVILMSDSRIFHKNGDTFVDTWDNIMERSKDALDLLESSGGLSGAITTINQKIEEGTQVADRIEDFITETEFYGYTILLSREAFVIKAKEDGNVDASEYSDIYTDVIVYKGATQITAPDLKLSLANQTNCEFEIVGQRIKLKTGSMNVDAIKGQATVVIDCGDGLVAQRIIEVTKVFDGVSQYQVEIGNSFYSFNANSDGKIEEEQSVTCDINVTKANELYESYTVTVQNMPKGMTHNIVNGSKVNNVTFTATTGETLPDNGTVSIVVQMADNTVINKTFSFGKTKQGVDAKSLILTGNQIVKYDTPDYTDTPSPYRSIIHAQVSGLSGTPNWYVLNENNEWDLIVGQSSTTLEVYHNDSVIWKDRKETTIKCELDEYSDEITLIKIANGATGSDAYSVLLSNEASTIPTDEEGIAPTNEVQKQYTTVTVYKGAEIVAPSKIEVEKNVNGLYSATIVDNEVRLQSISSTEDTIRIPINITVDGLTFQRVWSITKSKQGSVGASGSTLILNIEGGTRSITYNQMNTNPRPMTSSSFTARLYDNGVEVLEGVGYYWTCVGHMSGTSTTRTFAPTIAGTFDEGILSNQVTVTVTYKGNKISNTAPIVISKDVSGIDWVTDWDSRKVTIRDTEVLTPKIFAGTYNQASDSVTGVAIGQDVLNDGQTIGIVAYQDNTPTLLVGTDGSIEIGDPYQNRNVNGVGIGYNNGQFVGRFSSLTIAGVDVPTQEVVDEKITQAVADAQNQLKAEVDEVNSALVDLNDYVSNSMRDGILDEVEKGKIDNLMEIVKQEVADVEGQYISIHTNEYLTDASVIQALDLAYTEYQTVYTDVNTKYNGLVASGSETGEIAGMVTTGDTAVDVGDGEVSTDVPEGGTDDSGLVVEEVPEIGEDDIVDSGGEYPQLTVTNVEEFMLALDNFRIASNNLYQVMNQALTSISESQATQITEKAKEEVIKEVKDVSDALTGLENTMNGEFKTGLIGSINLSNLNERLKQLDIEKKDIDGQYSVISTNTALDSTTKNKLVSAKGTLDSAHTTLVTKINSVIADNLLTTAELEEVNNLITAYSTALGNYSKVAQEANIAIAVNTAKNTVDAITDEQVFNKVTNFGKTQGLFIENGGKVYINAQYIQTRGFVATKDDGTKTFEIDKNGNVNIVANSFTLTGQGNIATEDYVNNAVSQVSNGAINIILSNEAQVISTNANSLPLATQSFAVKVQMYKATNEITNFTIGSVSSANGITASVSQTTKTVTFSVSTSTTISAVSGKITIPITYDGKTYSKDWSWAIAKQGNTGATGSAGTNAKAVDIIASSQVFKSTDGGTTFSPNTITLTPKLQNLTYSNWQYSINGGSSWTTVASGSNGLTISGGVLTVSKDSALFTSSVTSVAFRVNTNDSSFYDVVTVVKLHDVGDLEIGGRNYIQFSDFKNNTSEWVQTKHASNTGSSTVADGVMTITSSGSEWIQRQIYSNKTATALLNIKNGQKYTMSAEFMVGATSTGTATVDLRVNYKDGSTSNRIRVQQDLSKLTPNVWTKVEVTSVVTFTESSFDYWRIIPQGVVGQTVKYRNFKLEDGDKSTSWTPAIEDISQEINDSIKDYDKTLSQLAVFNKLTNNGATQGIYLENSKLYINGEYIKAGTIVADDITSGTFKGTSFEAGGSSGSGSIVVKDYNNKTTFQADRNGIYASRIDFETPSYKGDANVSVDYGGFHSIFERSIGGGGDATTKEGVLESRLTNTELFLRAEGHSDIIGYDTKTGETRITASEVSTWGAISGGSLQTDTQLKFLFDGGGTTANLWSKSQNSITGNGQMLTSLEGHIYVGNPSTYLTLEGKEIHVGSNSGAMLSNDTNGNRLNITSSYGTVTIGSYNGDWSHFETDRPAFWFSKGVHVAGEIYAGSSYNQRVFHQGWTPRSGNWWNGGAVVVAGDGVCEVGKYLDFHNTNSSVADYDVRLEINSGGLLCSGGLRASGGMDCNNGYWLNGRNVILNSSSGGLDFGNTTSGIALHSSVNPVYWNGMNIYQIYTEAFKPTSTSDIRYKRALSPINTDSCYDMVKNININSYLLLEEGIEDEHEVDRAFLRATQEEGVSRKLQMGVIAQDLLKYDFGQYVVVQDVTRDKETGEVTNDKYSIDAYNYASAILGGLQKEIQIRDEQYEELKQENEELKAKVGSLEQRLARLEALLGQE